LCASLVCGCAFGTWDGMGWLGHDGFGMELFGVMFCLNDVMQLGCVCLMLYSRTYRQSDFYTTRYHILGKPLCAVVPDFDTCMP
jgi:hypothetical protein